MMTLFGYWRSSASYRVRIALNLKGVQVEHRAINLKAGEQHEKQFEALNPQPLVPVLQLADGTRLTQSMAILDYLEEAFPQPPLLPPDSVARAQVRGVAQIIGCDIAPIQNLRVLRYLETPLGHNNSDKEQWVRHWIRNGLESLERFAATRPQTDREFLFGAKPGYAECLLIPQIYNARRYNVDMSEFPLLSQIDALCAQQPSFVAAHPDKQSDSVHS